jgi:hypothetical protein
VSWWLFFVDYPGKVTTHNVRTSPIRSNSGPQKILTKVDRFRVQGSGLKNPNHGIQIEKNQQFKPLNRER